MNAVIASAIASWILSARVRRLIQPVYEYDKCGLNHLTLIIAESI